MKKVLLSVLLVFGVLLSANAETYKFYSTDFAYKIKDSDGYWGEWSDWEKSHCLITISTDRDVINIYSQTPQEFDIYETVGESSDDDEGETIEFKCVDADGLRCHIRIRKQKDGVLQMYVDYDDIMYVYCLEKRN
jgi:hypothetical protein